MMISWKEYAPLLKKRKRQEEKKFLVEGVRMCREALQSGWEVEIAFAAETFQQSRHWQEFADIFRLRNIDCRAIPPQHFKRLADTETPQGIVLVMRMPSFNLENLNLRPAVFVALLDGIRDPGNLGTIIRTADWFGAAAVILSGDCVDPYNSKVLRGTMGSIFHLPVYAADHLADEIAKLKHRDFRVIAMALNAEKTLQEISFEKPLAIILGNEAHGLSPEIQQLADFSIRIDKYGRAESLNAAVAGGIIMNYIAQQTGKLIV